MNKRLILCGTLVVALAINVGCQKEEVKDIKLDNNPAIAKTVGMDNGKENNIIKIESDKIDFSGIEYKPSETEKSEELEKIIIDYLQYDKKEDEELEYFYNYIDLNGDEKEEIFVYLIGKSVSGSGGSTALIIDKESHKIISNFTLVQNPIIISEEKTNGWNNIIMNVSGGGVESFYAKLGFDGEKYPSNPSMASEVEEGSVVKGIAIISENICKGDGIEIK
ncbi:hypothetical protein [Tissierella sp.]|uniref:hypothetical protein n=1 Tax=Tissierella sp. TaxID=41274 RepID=UPI0028B0A142|nr:hypothetical protein [Tissierella sp.]